MEEIFNEKYRPKEFEEVVGLDSEIEKLISSGNIPHFLFSGPPGTGKTTTARIIIKKLNADALILNASKERGIDIIRNKIEPFAAKASNVPKIVFLDEFDATTPQFQDALRNFMEFYSYTTRFIATCNYINKIEPALLSRFTLVKFSNYSQEAKEKRIKEIAKKENIQIDDETLSFLVKKYRDDIRSMVNFLNKNKNKSILKEDISYENLVLDILAKLKDKKWLEIREKLLPMNLDYGSLIEEMDRIIFYNKAIPIDVKIKANTILAEGEFQLYFSFNKELAFASILAKLQVILQW